MAQRALRALKDYWCLLEGLTTPEPPARAAKPSPADKDRVADFWLAVQDIRWAREGRLALDGRLRVGSPPSPWTLEAVARTLPDLGEYEQVAVLIDLDGVVAEGWMADERQTRLRAVIEEMIDTHVSRIFGSAMRDMLEQRKAEIDRPRATSIMRPLDGGPGGARRKRRRDPETGKMLAPEEWDRRQDERHAQDEYPKGGHLGG